MSFAALGISRLGAGPGAGLGGTDASQLEGRLPSSPSDPIMNDSLDRAPSRPSDSIRTMDGSHNRVFWS